MLVERAPCGQEKDLSTDVFDRFFFCFYFMMGVKMKYHPNDIQLSFSRHRLQVADKLTF